jgi:hypothetical protein
MPHPTLDAPKTNKTTTNGNHDSMLHTDRVSIEPYCVAISFASAIASSTPAKIAHIRKTVERGKRNLISDLLDELES